MFTSVQSITIHNSQRGETTQIFSTDEWINKMRYIGAMRYY